MKNLDRLIARAAETHKYFKGQTDLDYVAIDIKQANAIKAEVDARISELTKEVADLKSKLDFANAMNADQDKDVTRYKAALEKIASARTNGLPKIHASETPTIARNALKDGV
jgi:chromosome segregation ATPase